MTDPNAETATNNEDSVNVNASSTTPSGRAVRRFEISSSIPAGLATIKPLNGVNYSGVTVWKTSSNAKGCG